MVEDRVRKFIDALPPSVTLVIAAKGRSVEQVEAAIRAGGTVVGENYVQEAQRKYASIGSRVSWHCLGHLQTNKARAAAGIFDMVQTLDSLRLAECLDKECARLGRRMCVLIEVNSAAEPQKSGVLPDACEDFAAQLSRFPHILPCGLMTMGPLSQDPQALRPYFKKTRELFEKIKASGCVPQEWRILSMGMSSSYVVAIEEGATMVRIGTALFEE